MADERGQYEANGSDGWSMAWWLPSLLACLVFALVCAWALFDLRVDDGPIGVSLAVIGGLITFFGTRMALKPIDTLTRQLVDRSTVEPLPAQLAGPATELGRLQRAIAERMHEDERAAELAASEGDRAREAMLARLSAALAHEVRNPLAGMSAALSTLRRYGDDPKVRSETLDLVERGLASIDHVAASMLSTYRPPDAKRALTPDDIQDLHVLIRPKARRKSIDIRFASALSGPVNVDADAIRQIVLNLLLNATDAAPDGGAVGFEASLADDRLSLTVSDDGPGLPDEALMVITDRDGRNAGQATGQTKRLGLWLVHKLIDDVNGRLSIESRTEKGTSITITVPVLETLGGEHLNG
ncbi:MAG: HAMP domain-containing sensor histidine kinase [Pseudomonadota bacterium]